MKFFSVLNHEMFEFFFKKYLKNILEKKFEFFSNEVFGNVWLLLEVWGQVMALPKESARCLPLMQWSYYLLWWWYLHKINFDCIGVIKNYSIYKWAKKLNTVKEDIYIQWHAHILIRTYRYTYQCIKYLE
jgi:hypothetical protein